LAAKPISVTAGDPFCAVSTSAVTPALGVSTTRLLLPSLSTCTLAASPAAAIALRISSTRLSTVWLSLVLALATVTSTGASEFTLSENFASALNWP